MCQRWLLFVLVGAPTVQAIVQEYYTTNAVCKQKYCINPVFPGLLELDSLSKLRWQKYELKNTGHYLGFCKKFVDYDFALPVIDYSKKWNYSSHTTEDKVLDQEQQAAKLFFFHLSAMGLDAWDYPSPESDNNMPMTSCVKQVARMACFTYLPQANPATSAGMDTRYLKPCKSSCGNYVKESNVEC